MAYLPIKPFTFNYMWSAASSPADSTTYFATLSGVTWQGASSTFDKRLLFPNNCIIKSLFGNFTVGGTLGSSENTTFAIRVNGTTTTNVSTTVQMTATSNSFSNAALSINITAGDYIEFLITTPAWVTNPTSVSLSLSMYAE